MYLRHVLTIVAATSVTLVASLSGATATAAPDSLADAPPGLSDSAVPVLVTKDVVDVELRNTLYELQIYEAIAVSTNDAHGTTRRDAGCLGHRYRTPGAPTAIRLH